MELGQIIHLNARQGIRDDSLRLLGPGNPSTDRFQIHRQQLGRGGCQLFLRKEAVTGGQIVGKLKQQASLHPPGVIPRYPQLDGKSIHRAERSLQALIHQKIWVVIQ